MKRNIHRKWQNYSETQSPVQATPKHLYAQDISKQRQCLDVNPLCNNTLPKYIFTYEIHSVRSLFSRYLQRSFFSRWKRMDTIEPADLWVQWVVTLSHTENTSCVCARCCRKHIRQKSPSSFYVTVIAVLMFKKERNIFLKSSLFL